MKIYSSKRYNLSLESYAGKDVWIKVDDTISLSDKYINICSFEPDSEVILYRRIPCNILDYAERNHHDISFDYVFGYFYHRYKAHISNFKIIEPVDVFSTDELLSMITSEEIKQSVIEALR